MEGLSEERRALVGELVQVLEMARQLDAHMAGQQLGGGGEERCRALVATMRASIDRSVRIARSCCADEAAGRLPVLGRPESQPSGGGDGSPLSAGSDQAGDSRGRGNAAGQCKKRKSTQPKWKTQVRVSAVQDVAPLDDGISWRKYGQKDILGAKYPRAYFRCTHRHSQDCHASKQVQRADGDPLLFDVVYNGYHTCAQAQAAARPSNQETPHAASGENSPPQQTQAGLEQTTGDSTPMFERTVQPFALPSNNPAYDDGCKTSSGFPAGSVVAASAFMSSPAVEATPESQLVTSSSSNHAVGVWNVPEVELASTTNSPMGGHGLHVSAGRRCRFLGGRRILLSRREHELRGSNAKIVDEGAIETGIGAIKRSSLLYPVTYNKVFSCNTFLDLCMYPFRLSLHKQTSMPPDLH